MTKTSESNSSKELKFIKMKEFKTSNYNKKSTKIIKTIDNNEKEDEKKIDINFQISVDSEKSNSDKQLIQDDPKELANAKEYKNKIGDENYKHNTLRYLPTYELCIFNPSGLTLSHGTRP
ncbi:6165_t:CDS:2 [Cetraspora pellucida]|uniref:6165_t:CDS:1 n=1 Tax=Cetraspora pellucida TaxID=1433469 RepID=A0A9N9IUM3_9GLOM|nr:6165_t:CDS:2 [Cetraspora pellucida]